MPRSYLKRRKEKIAKQMCCQQNEEDLEKGSIRGALGGR